jgi:hypothetical protein
MDELEGTGPRFDPIEDILGDDLQGTGFAAWRFRRRFRGSGGAEPEAYGSADPRG